MLNILSILIGLVATPLVVMAFLPLMGWANWLILPLPVVGVLVGSLSSSGNAGRNFNIALLAIGALRLMLGGGVF
ncbi:hypothetical protein PQ455_09680 [Sphingomonas naphthae]|uniref:Uncharacterized protein n=1 Tax=Sphingomonas naphthae TaxID=1813468 RepID=A0ABY7THW1_9SPHN|nr:hypothetical protein [Sphingomonas naphthae]WCT71924.1 hypothetical protein PQ455_09680 [Sphingomonas naphthae]